MSRPGASMAMSRRVSSMIFRPLSATLVPAGGRRHPIPAPSKGSLHPRQRLAKGLREALALGRRERACDRYLLTARDQAEPLEPELIVVFTVDLRPQRIEAPFPALPTRADTAEHQLDRAQHDLLEGAAAPETDPERDVERDKIEPEETRDRPEAENHEGNACRGRAEAAQDHENTETTGVKRPVRLDDRGEERLHERVDRRAGRFGGSLAAVHPANITRRCLFGSR